MSDAVNRIARDGLVMKPERKPFRQRAAKMGHLAAIAIQHGLEVCSADTDFARFTKIRWRNPLATQSPT